MEPTSPRRVPAVVVERTSPSRKSGLGVALPRRSRSSTFGGSPKKKSPPPSPRFPSPMVGDGPSASTVIGERQADFPLRLRWSIVMDLQIPEGWSPVKAVDVVAEFFEVVETCESQPQSTASVLIAMAKSPRKLHVKRCPHEAVWSRLPSLGPLCAINDWSAIFHARLAIKGSLISGHSLDTLEEITSHVTQKSGGSDVPSDVVKLLFSLKDFLDSHRVDVDSATVGMEVHPSFAASICFDDGGGLDGVGKNKQMLYSDAKSLQARIVELSEMGPDEGFSELLKLASVFKHHELYALKRGNLVVAQAENRVSFARVLRWLDDGTMELHVGNRTVKPVAAAQCVPLSSELKSLVERGQISQVVKDHVATVQRLLTKETRTFVESQILKNWSNDGGAKTQTRAFFEAAASTTTRTWSVFDHSFIDELNERTAVLDIMACAKEQDFVARLQVVQQTYVDGVSLSEICAKNRAECISGMVQLGRIEVLEGLVCEFFVEQRKRIALAAASIETQFEAILSGARKNEMAKMWLGAVRKGVDALLVERGFEADAVEDDYISTAPKSVEAVQGNLQILQSLSRNEDKSSALFLLGQALKAEVYPIIETFINEAFYVVSVKLGCLLSPNIDPLVQLQAAIEERQECARERGVLEDVVYLREMRRLEDNPNENSPHIVPISGLVCSAIIRKEKEHSTVLEVWGRSVE